MLEWVAIPSSQPRDQIQDSWIVGRFFTIWATMEALDKCSPFIFTVIADASAIISAILFMPSVFSTFPMLFSPPFLSNLWLSF